MKNLGWIALAAMSAVAFSGCNDFGSPRGVVGTAYQAIKDNDSSLFFETLMGEASERYGTLSGMLEVRKTLEGQAVEVGPARLVDVKYDGWGWPVLRVYRGDVLGHQADSETAPIHVLYEATVSCQVRYTFDQPGCANPHHPGCHQPGHYTERSFCRISRLK